MPLGFQHGLGPISPIHIVSERLGQLWDRLPCSALGDGGHRCLKGPRLEPQPVGHGEGSSSFASLEWTMISVDSPLWNLASLAQGFICWVINSCSYNLAAKRTAAAVVADSSLQRKPPSPTQEFQKLGFESRTHVKPPHAPGPRGACNGRSGCNASRAAPQTPWYPIRQSGDNFTSISTMIWQHS